MKKSIKRLLGKGVYYVMGWRYDARPSFIGARQVLVGMPHTTNMDGVRALALCAIYDLKAFTLIKKELVRFPFRWLFRMMNFIPVDRASKDNLVDQLAERCELEAEFSLVIAPQASRNRSGVDRPPIRSGFWYIAQAARIPIVLMFSDLGQKRIRVLGQINPGNLAEDLLRIQSMYAAEGVHIGLPITTSGIAHE